MIDEALEKLTNHVHTISNKELRSGTAEVITHIDFLRFPAAKSKHQAYPGGLIVHTYEVTEMAVMMAKAPFLQVNLDVLITAAVWHDFAKIYDYKYVRPGERVDVKDVGKDLVVEYTEHHDLVRHLPRSFAMFVARFQDKIPESLITQIGHCIMSHHGREEWGSPVEPKTTEAHILHYADMMSARCAQDLYRIP